MTEIHFIVEEAPEGGYVARAMGADIFTDGDDFTRYMSRCVMPSAATLMKAKCPA